MKTLNSLLVTPKKYFVAILTVFALCISSSAFAANIYWDNNSGDGLWSTVANWSSTNGSHTAVSLIPTSTDQVTITGVYTVTISTDVGTINKLVVQTSAAGAPTLVITSGGTLTVSNTTTTAQPQVVLVGGIIQNAGTLNITTYTGASVGLEFRSSTSTTPVASSYSGSGALTINSSLGTSQCVYFSQTNADPVFSVGGTISLSAASTVAVISVGSGSHATINGTGSITIGSSGTPASCGLIYIPSHATLTNTLTIESGVTLSIYSNMSSTSNAPIRLAQTASNAAITFTNKGTLYIGGTSANGIYSGTNTSSTINFDNQGTINFTGAYSTASAGAMSFGGAGTAYLTNSGTILVSNMTVASSKGIYMTASPTVTITNTGIITFDATNVTTGAMITMGDSKSKFDNTGTVTINKGYLAGTGTGNALFNNNVGGKVTISGTGSSVAISTYLLFTNQGTFEANGTVTNGGFAPSTGTVSPGGASGIGSITFYQAATGSPTFSLTGKALMNVNGKTTAGTDYDQITVSTAGASLDVSGATLEINVGGSYTPADAEAISLFTGATARIGNFSSVTLPSLNWSMDYGTTTAAKVKYISTASTTIASGYAVVLSNNVTTNALTINSGGTLTVNAGKQLTVSSMFSNSGILSLLSDGTNGTATILTPATIGGSGGTYNVQQNLSATRNWYLSSPLTNAAAPSSYTYYQYDEPGNPSTQSTIYWETVNSGTSFVPGRGYIALPASVATPFTFTTSSGSLNTGDITINGLTRTTGKTKEGFNLIGNPYPSHITMSYASLNGAGFDNEIWYRTSTGYDAVNSKYTYAFNSFLMNSDGTTVASPSGTTGIVAPMQAFWVRKSNAGNGSLTFTNTMRSHQTANPLKIKSDNSVAMPLLRIEVSNSSAITDEAVVYFNSNALDSYDTYDAVKFTDANAAVQIYTTVGGEQLVINGMNSIPYNTEIPLVFSTNQESINFSIKASELNSFDFGTQIILKDYIDVNNPVIKDLSDGSGYTFGSGVTTNNTSRFALLFKSPSAATGINPESNSNVCISTRNGQIMITGNPNNETLVTVYNAIGQKLENKLLTKNTTLLNKTFSSGVYMVTVGYKGKTTTQKVIIN